MSKNKIGFQQATYILITTTVKNIQNKQEGFT